ncbi:NB-ARC domain, LRR domain containing protein [Parasponia andersonii]|uniref:NB-ARC domain, LRR domain containing protein n=1 Tax=Parasponia andersonii TaxID=3476 RepID=A0A2P5AD12_PARAD|nr:NB-ARC domain, LRR domain containing protein [Parasponia andersonii]
MAAEMVFGAVVSSSVEYLVDKITSSDVVSYLRGKKESGFDGLVENLETTFLCLGAVLADAEQKQIRNPGVAKWLDKLQAVVDDAEDLFDEIEYDALKLKVEAESGTSTSKVSNFLNFSNSTDEERKTKMEEILGRLENFAKQINILGLNRGVGENLWRSLPTTSLMEFEVYGRDNDKDVVMELLMFDAAGREVCVIPIVGMGGVGKTTLAQAVFNDGEVERQFQFKAWVCVSDEFDVFRVTKTVLGEADASNIEDLNLLQDKLKDKLKGKKFLIVLDDVWNENYVAWNNLKKPFKYGAQGSKIIVTTRSGNVASIMGTVPTHHLKQLTDEDCWEIFAKHASSGINGDFTSNSDLERIGREIVKKCKGLPLAATTLGGLLRSTLDVRKWERIAKSEFWELTDEQSNILPALRLSYYYLPSHLKRCFAYCSIFPKDYEFEKEELVLLWMADNLLEHSKRNMKMEEVGYEYFSDLVSRSFFQRSSSNRSHFVMHDLMVDLAKFVSRKKYLLIEEGKSYESGVMKQTRHIAYDRKCHDPQEISKSISEATWLRTFLPLELEAKYLTFESVNILVHDLLNLRYLRYLSLNGYQEVKQLPKTIGELRHLRYFDLSKTSISVLPESLNLLYNLQTLKLSQCSSLTKLPKNFHHLINLRYLDVKHSGLVEMPTQISKLKSLQKLSAFIVGKNSGASMGELGELSNLTGKLCIYNLQNVMKANEDAWAAKLRDKRHLEELDLEWGYETNDAEHERDVLENLLPNTILKKLNIVNYAGMTFPIWLGDHSFDNLIDLSLSGCKLCHTLPPLGQLPSLKTLSIVNFDGLETVGLDFYGVSTSTVKSFASLESLRFHYLIKWKKWSIPIDNVVAFPKLRKLDISKCSKLTGDLSCLLPSLIELSITFCSELASSLPVMPSADKVKLCYSNSLPGFQDVRSFSCLQNLEIYFCQNLEFPLHHVYESLQELSIHSSCSFIRLFPLDSFPNLRKLHIEGCENLESLSQFKGLNALTSLCIVACPNFTFFPNSKLDCPILTRLELRYCKKLKFLPNQLHTLLPFLQHLEITDCPELESFPRSTLPFSLRKLEIGYNNKVVAQLRNWNLQALPNLTSFTILRCEDEDIESFPEEGLLPTTITHLNIYSLDCLKSLDERGFQELTSLRDLCIRNCQNLQTLPEEGLPTSLEELRINQCPLLTEKCEREKGEYWNKIARIAFIFINDEQVQPLLK